VIYFYSKTSQIHQFLKFILLCSSTLHASDGLSVHHHESKTVYTASGICQTDSADYLLAGMRWNWFHLVPASKQPQNLFRCAIPVVLVHKDQYRKQMSHNTTAYGIYFLTTCFDRFVRPSSGHKIYIVRGSYTT